jgi:hypothetical protein
VQVESAIWFAAQCALGAVTVLLGRCVATARPLVWKSTAAVATVLALLWPLMRWFPADALGLLGARVLMHIEVTGMIPAVLLVFTIGAAHVKRVSGRRLSALLVLVCALYFVRTGLWMVRPPVPELGKTKLQQGVCLQSTPYTCVAASLVTLLSAHGVPTTETEMARLSQTEVYGGATDTRAVRALERRLAGHPFEIHYEVMSYDRLRQVEPPCLVSTRFGFFVSHMMPVLSATERAVVLGDPLCGRRVLTVAEFRAIWHKRGIYLRSTAPAVTRRPDGD